MIAGRSRAVSLLGVVTLAAPLVVVLSAQAAERPPAWIPVGPGAELNLFSKATTGDPLEIQTNEPSEIEFAHVSITPNGTTGAVARGTVVVAVNQGVATALSADGGRCTSRTVSAGSAFIQPMGSVGEIRNEGSDTLELYATSLTPTGLTAATPPAGPCKVTTPRGVTTMMLNHSVIDAPLDTESKGSSDVWVGLVRVAAGGNIGWHVQQRPLFIGVDQGEVTLKVAHDGTCDVTVFPATTGFFEPPQMVHEVRNNTKSPAFFYFIGFAPSPQPLITPATPPKECEKS